MGEHALNGAGSSAPPPVLDPRLLPPATQIILPPLEKLTAPGPEEMLTFVPEAATGARPQGTGARAENNITPAPRPAGATRRRTKIAAYRPHEVLGLNLGGNGQLLVRLARKGSAGHEWARFTEIPRDMIATAISRQFRGQIPRLNKTPATAA